MMQKFLIEITQGDKLTPAELAFVESLIDFDAIDGLENVGNLILTKDLRTFEYFCSGMCCTYGKNTIAEW